MSGEEVGYKIKDDHSVANNLATFADALKKRDADLASILIPILGDLSSGQAVARDELLDAMFAATLHSEEQGE